MKKLMMKAKAGVTLVELLVVILIVTILSVSMLPLLQPFVTEAQYAAEAIPVIGNLRTKVGLYQYDKGSLPAPIDATKVQTWVAGVAGTDENGDTVSDSEKYACAWYTLPAGVAREAAEGQSETKARNNVEAITDNDELARHLGRLVDVNYEDLKGKRSKPCHYQYYAISSSNNFSYVLACFGDGNGLKAGTGYAVCEITLTGAQKKYIGTWKRYKPTSDDAGQLQFGSQAPTDAATKIDYCYVPSAEDFPNLAEAAKDKTGVPDVISDMILAGWEF